MKNYIYPCSFNFCILRCFVQNGNNTSVIYTKNNKKFDSVQYVQLSFDSKIFENNYIFKCDLLEAKDGGLPFLHIIEVIQGIEKDVNIILDKYFIDSINNDIRVKKCILFPLSSINYVYQYILPNFYGICNGVAFMNDSINTNDSIDSTVTLLKNMKTLKTEEFIVKKGNLPEIYEISKYKKYPNTTSKNDIEILYIPTICIAKKIYSLIKKSNEIIISCSFDMDRQRWIPVIH